jgi:transcriptional regulator with AAA-type ATPase domain
MSVAALYLHPDPTKRDFLRASIRGDLRHALAAARDGGASAFCVIGACEVGLLEVLGDALRREQQPRQARQVVACRRAGCALLITKVFTSAERARQSLEAYREYCLRTNGWAVVFVVLEDQLFNTVRRDTREPSDAERRLLGLDVAMRFEHADLPTAGAGPAWANGIGDETVSPELCKAFLGDSPIAKHARFLVMRIKSANCSVLLLGPPGSGKEILARHIHALSPDRCAGKLKPVNCAGLDDLFESQMFGHKKGSFTGAICDHDGYFIQANKGVLFLDEITELSLASQGKLLRALEDQQVQVVGGDLVPVNVRVIAATNRDIFAMVAAGTFREDLFYRIHGIVIRTPALRDHVPDIALIARAYWATYEGKGAPPLGEDFIAAISAYAWPGNVRELRSRLEALHAVFGDERLAASHFHWLLDLERGAVRGLEGGHESTAKPDQRFLRSLSHVDRAISTVRHMQVAMRPPIRDGLTDERTLAIVAIEMRHGLSELEFLCDTTPECLHIQEALRATRAFKNEAGKIADLVLPNPAECIRRWLLHGESLSEEATSVLFQAKLELESFLRPWTSPREGPKNSPRPLNNPPLDFGLGDTTSLT